MVPVFKIANRHVDVSFGILGSSIVGNPHIVAGVGQDVSQRVLADSEERGSGRNDAVLQKDRVLLGVGPMGVWDPEHTQDVTVFGGHAVLLKRVPVLADHVRLGRVRGKSESERRYDNGFLYANYLCTFI